MQVFTTNNSLLRMCEFNRVIVNHYYGQVYHFILYERGFQRRLTSSTEDSFIEADNINSSPHFSKSAVVD